jgi:hypothetical protein
MSRLRRRGFTLGKSRAGEVEVLLWEELYFYLHVGSCIPTQSQLLIRRVVGEESWNYMRDLDRTVSVAHYMADYMLNWPLRCCGQSVMHELMFMPQDHDIGLSGCEGSIYTNQKVYDIF